LRRTRDAMGNAARFRLVFGWAEQRSVSAKERLGHLAVADGTPRRVNGGLRRAIAHNRLCADTRIAYGLKPIAYSPEPGGGYEESLKSSRWTPAARRTIAAVSRSTTTIGVAQTGH